MKKAFFLFIFIICICITIFSQNQSFPRLAVVSFTTNLNNERIKADAVTVREVVESEMVKTRKYEIITREDIDKLLENQSIQVSRISSSENLRKLQLHNISYIVTGSINATGNNYVITVRILDVATGEFKHSENDIIGNQSRELYTGITGLMNKFNSNMYSDGDGVIQTGNDPNVNYDLSGTTWSLKWLDIEDEIRFTRDGKIILMSNGGINNTWMQLDDHIKITIDNSTVYEGYFVTNDLIEGNAMNRRGSSGRFELRKKY